MNSLTKETQLTLLYIFIAFTFSVLMRMIWISQFSDYEAFKHAGEFMINTNDGYLWAEGARDILSGISQENDLSPITSAPSLLTAFFATLLPFSFETIILYLPVYLSSLIVIPIILIAKNLKNLEMGLIAALLASIAWSYYNRTMVGYYDTDMLNIVLPMFLLWSIIWAIQTHENKYLIITALDILVYRWWYPQSYALEFAFIGLILLYVLIYDRKNIYTYKLLALMMLSMSNFDLLLRVPLILAIFFLFTKEQFNKYTYYILGFSVVFFFVGGGLSPIIGLLNTYIFSRDSAVSNQGLELHFYAVIQTIREAGHIPFETFANRISGHTITFILSIVGYIYLVYKHRIMIIALPMVGLGFLASFGGLRFTVYAVPILALGIAFLITQAATSMPTKKLQYLSMFLLLLAVLFPNYKHIESYRVPTVMNASEVSTLAALKEKADREDYVIAWWDYGYPIRYYADVKTLTDGAKHSGSENFPVSYILTSPLDEAAKMARLDVEFTEKSYRTLAESKDTNKTHLVTPLSTIEEMTTSYGFDDTNDFLYSLQTDIELPKKTREIYFYLPYQMLNIYPTVKVFSNLDLMTGKKATAPFFFISRNFKEAKDRVILNNAVFLDKKTMELNIQGKKVKIRRLVQTGYSKGMQFTKNVQNITPQANLSVIYMSAYNTFLVIDEKTYNSLYVKLMILEEYNSSVFEQVITNPHAKIYKLRI